MLNDLKKAFSDLKRDSENVDPEKKIRGRVQGFIMPMPLYTAYLETYVMVAAFAEKLDDVINNPEHKLLLEDGKHLGYNMPDETQFREKLETLKELLNGFEPHDVRYKSDGAVFVSGEMARGFILTAIVGCDLVNDVFMCLRDTDYLPVFTHLKKLGAAYCGPSSLQEAVNTWQSLVRAHNANTHYNVKRSLPAGWTDVVSSWRRNNN